jgi:hypothetical protein
MSSPNRDGSWSSLDAVAAASPNDVWAVGYSQQTGSSPFQTLVEHWNGGTWSIVPSPNAIDGWSLLTGVLAISPNNVWAVGYNQPGNASFAPLVEHWDGTSWIIVATAGLGTGVSGALSAITMGSSSNDLWAVGYAATGSQREPLIERWNGAGWAAVAGAALGADTTGTLNAVTSTGSSLWTVGESEKGGVSQPLIESWDGKSWSQAQSPPLVSGASGSLSGVVALPGGNVWAVGRESLPQAGSQPLIERWDGATWSMAPTPDLGSAPAGLNAISGTSSNDVYAVGTYRASETGAADQALIEHLVAAPTTFALQAPTVARTGKTIAITVTAADLSGAASTAYTGTVHFTSSDGAAGLPSDYTFTAADAGTHTFTVIPGAPGRLTLTVTDTAASSITASVQITVSG